MSEREIALRTKKKVNVLPRGLHLGSYDGQQTYLETCTCKSAWCNQPTVYLQGTDTVCWPQTHLIRHQQSVCGHLIDINTFEEQNRFSDESISQPPAGYHGRNTTW